MGFAILGLLIGEAIGLAVGTSVNRCDAPTSISEPAVLTLHLDEPYNLDVAGPGVCIRNIASGQVEEVERQDEGPTPVHWTMNGLDVMEIAMGYGGTDPGLQIGLWSGAAHELWRQSANQQVARTVTNEESGMYVFNKLPIEDQSAAQLTPYSETLSGTLAWHCPDDSLTQD
jgi:hypothetical protein